MRRETRTASLDRILPKAEADRPRTDRGSMSPRIRHLSGDLDSCSKCESIEK